MEIKMETPRLINRDARICIIGAGMAGLTAANYLNKAGFNNVTVLEKLDRTGGKCLGLNKDGGIWKEGEGEAYEMGAGEYTFDYKHIIELLIEFKLESHNIAPVVLLDQMTGNEKPLTDLYPKGIKEDLDLMLAVFKYFTELGKVHAQVGVSGFHNLTPDLCIPFGTWLDKNGLTILRNAFLFPVSLYGYGSLDVTPAAYILKYFDRLNFFTLLWLFGWEALGKTAVMPLRPKNGFGALTTALENAINNNQGSSVRTGVNILGITRTDTEVTVNIEGKSPEIYDELILTMPLELSNLSFLDLSPEEKFLFGKVIHNNYYTTLAKVTSLDYKGYAPLLNGTKVQVPNSGDVFLMARYWADSDLTVIYSYSDTPMDIKAVQEKVIKNLGSMNLKVTDIKSTQIWDYFPHVSSENLPGFYEKLATLQGTRRTYYGGGLLNFELVENVTAWSKYLVDRWFS